MNWIKTEEQLPANYEFVIVALDDGDVFPAQYFSKDKKFLYLSHACACGINDRSLDTVFTDNDLDCDPIYWMSMPNAPKESDGL